LVAAAYLHDIGYAPDLQRTGLHHCVPAIRATGGWLGCAASRSATAGQPPSSSKPCRRPTLAAAAPTSITPL
jgi:hypothetical protein